MRAFFLLNAPLLATAMGATPTVPTDAVATVRPAPGGAVILPTPRAVELHDRYRYAAARRVGNTLYVSGAVATVPTWVELDGEGFKSRLRIAFLRLAQVLETAGIDFSSVALVNSFHVWEHPGLRLSKREQVQAFSDVLGEFMKPPYAAWTAVGTTGFVTAEGAVEIQVIAHVGAKPD